MNVTVRLHLNLILAEIPANIPAIPMSNGGLGQSSVIHLADWERWGGRGRCNLELY